jgi:HEAT repeat protein
MRIRGLRLAAEVDDPELDEAIRSSLDDPEPAVVETAAFVLGERLPASTASRERLESLAAGHPNVRRRAVLALVAFDDPQVDTLLETLTHDVDWQVRQAAEELLALS